MRTIVLQLLCIFCRAHRLRLQDEERHVVANSNVRVNPSDQTTSPIAVKALASLLNTFGRAPRRDRHHGLLYASENLWHDLSSRKMFLTRLISNCSASNANADESRDFGQSTLDSGVSAEASRSRGLSRRNTSWDLGQSYLDSGMSAEASRSRRLSRRNSSRDSEQSSLDSGVSAEASRNRGLLRRNTTRPNPQTPSDQQTGELEQPISNLDEKKDGSKKLDSFRPGRPLFDMAQTVQTALATQEEWRSTQVLGEMAISQGIMDVKAPPTTVWNQLYNFDTYPDKIIWVGKIGVYNREEIAAAEDTSVNITQPEPQQRRFPQMPFQLPQLPFQLPEFKLPESPFNLSQLPRPSIQLPPLPFRVPQLPPLGSFRMPFMQHGGTKPSEESLTSNHSTASAFGSTSERVSVEILSPIVPGIKIKSHLNFSFEPKHGSILWGLDHERSNDFEDMEGHFHVAPHPDGSANSRVYYEFGLIKPRWLPRTIFGAIAKRAIYDCSAWIKSESEREFAPLQAADDDTLDRSFVPPEVFKPYPGYFGYPF